MNARVDSAFGSVISGMDIAEYHTLRALGSTSIKMLARSPAHYYGRCLHPDRPVFETTPSMVAGTLAHTVLLEPNTIEQRYCVRPPGLDLRTKEGKAWAGSVPAGATPITEQQIMTAVRQARAVRELPEVAQLLSSGEAEVSALWADAATGVDCKCRPDWTTPAGAGVVLLDLKTTQSASRQDFSRTIEKFGYHLQAAWYSDGYERATGQPVLGFVFVCVEADFPHAAAAYMLDDRSLEKGRAECARLLQVYADCSASGSWPGYDSSIQVLSLPGWAF